MPGIDKITADIIVSIQNLKYKIRMILCDYRSIHVHRSKFACLCKDLLTFYKSLSALEIENRPETPIETQTFNRLIPLLDELHALFSDLGENTYFETLLKMGPFARKYVNDFRKTFNELIVGVPFLRDFVIPESHENQDCLDDCSDSKVLIELLEHAHDKSSQVDAFLVDLKKEVQEYEEKQDGKSEAMSLEEIEKELSGYSKWIHTHSDFKLQKKTGEGGFADVYYGYQKSTGRVVAIKKMHATEFTRDTFNIFKREVEIFTSLDHFAILPFVGVCIKPPFYIITVYMSGGSLFDKLHSDADIDPTKLTINALGIAHGMAYLHKKKMIHRDLKSMNILLDADDFPRICDFNISRTITDDPNGFMTSGVGTIQWMAPEIISGEKYDEKIDVYSYGIVLWEMLVRDVPYKGMKDMQIAQSVCKNGLRPLIPSSCPPKLKKLLQLCWERDPKRRPDFETIAQVFDSGEISFPGTSRDLVNAYLNQFNPSCRENISTKELITVIDPKYITKILSLLYEEPPSPTVFPMLKTFCNDPTGRELIYASTIIPRLIEIMKNCQSATIALEMVDIIFEFIKYAELREKLAHNHYSESLLELFMKFGTTAMKNFIEAIKVAVYDDPIKLNSKNFTKFSSFLVANDLSLRLGMTITISVFIRRKFYVSDNALIPIISKVLKNILIDSLPKLLRASIKLIHQLSQLPHSANYINKVDGTLLLIPLFKHPDSEIADLSFDSLKSLLMVSQPTPKLVSLFLNQFKSLVSILDIKKPLIILNLLSKAPSTFIGISNKIEIIETFEKCIKDQSNDLKIFTLKLISTFLYNEKSAPFISQISKSLIDLLDDNDIVISFLAASNLTLACSYITDRSFFLCDKVTNFLSNSFISQDQEMCCAALRLLGVLTSERQTAMFLDKTEIFKHINTLLESESESIQDLSYMAIASQSSSYVHTKYLYDCVPIAIENLSFYSTVFLANISTIPKAAVFIANNIHKILPQLSEDDEEYTVNILTIIYRISHNIESRQILNRSALSIQLFDQLMDIKEVYYSHALIKIFYNLLLAPNVKQHAKDIKFESFIEDNFKSGLNASTKYLYNQIISVIHN